MSNATFLPKTFQFALLAAPAPCSGELAGWFQIAFTKRKVEVAGGASWTMAQFDYLRASLAEAWPGGSAQARCSQFLNFINFGSHEERWLSLRIIHFLPVLLFFSGVATDFSPLSP